MSFVQPKVLRYSLFDDGVLIKSIGNEILDYTTRTFTITRESIIFEYLDSYLNIKNTYYYSISPSPDYAYQNNITTFNFTLRSEWTDTDVSKVCMKLELSNISINSEIFNTCINYNSQSQIYQNNIQLENKTYTFTTYAIINGEEDVLDVVILDLRRDKSQYGLLGLVLGVFLSMFAGIAGGMLGQSSGAIIGILLMVSGLSVIGLLPFNLITISGFWIVGIILMFTKRPN